MVLLLKKKRNTVKFKAALTIGLYLGMMKLKTI